MFNTYICFHPIGSDRLHLQGNAPDAQDDDVGKRENNRGFASVFLREGYDVVLLEYRVNNGITDVSDELADCAAALDYLTAHFQELNLNKDLQESKEVNTRMLEFMNKGLH